MSYFEYEVSMRLNAEDPPFYSLIMAAMRSADTMNAEKLRKAFPDTWAELQTRYDTVGGKIEGE